MSTFTIQVPDGRTLTIEAADQATALRGAQEYVTSNPKPAAPPGAQVTAPAQSAQPPSAPPDAPQPPAAGLSEQGLAMPTGGPPVNTGVPNQHFGFESSDTLNPLPAIAAGVDSAVAHLPLGGQALQSLRDSLNAGAYGGTPEQARADMNNTVAKNPEASVVGSIAGETLPYMGASEVPLLKAALGFEGPLAARVGLTGATQYAINTGNNLGHGDDPVTAAQKAILPTAASIPFALMGKGRTPGPEKAGAIKTLQDEGVPLTGGQMQNSKAIKTLESQAGGPAMQDFRDKQLSALTSAALSRTGTTAPAATPEVLSAIHDRIGSTMDNLTAMTTVKVDPTLQNAVLKAGTDYQQLVGQPAPIVENMINRIGTLAAQNGGVLKGDNYQVLVTDLRKAAENSSSNEVTSALKQIRSALDDAVERSMSGKTLAAWQTARQQYKNLVTVENAVGSTNPEAAKGYVTPITLARAVQGGDKRTYARGYGDLNKLAHAAQAMITTIPDSGTASRFGVMSAAPAMATAYHFGGPLAAVGTGASMAAPYIAAKAALSAPGRALIGAGGSKLPSALVRGLAPNNLPPTIQLPWASS